MQSSSTMTPTWLPGHLPLASGKSVGLEPRICGELKIGAGRVRIGTREFGPGAHVRLWRGDRVELANRAEATALFAWDVCESQPSRMERVRRRLQRIVRSVTRRARPPQLARCGDAWCLQR